MRLVAMWAASGASAPMASAIVGGASSGSVTAASDTQKTPSGKSSTASAASWSPSRVFPDPPGPVSVSSRVSRRIAPASSSSRSRPMSAEGCTGNVAR